VTNIDNFTLETYLCYSNKTEPVRVFIVYFIQKNLKARVLLDYDSTCLHVFYNIYIFVSKQKHSFDLKR